MTSFCLHKKITFFTFDKNAVVSAKKKKENFPAKPFGRNDIVLLSVTKKDAVEIEKNKNAKKSKKRFRVEK